jgi:uncharacterized protein
MTVPVQKSGIRAGIRESSRVTQNQPKIDPKLLEILVCPLTKGPLRYDADASELISEKAQLAYPIRDGIPIMLVDEARRLDGGAPAPRDKA